MSGIQASTLNQSIASLLSPQGKSSGQSGAQNAMQQFLNSVDASQAAESGTGTGASASTVANTYARISAQLSMEYQSVRLISDETGQQFTQETFNYSFQANIELAIEGADTDVSGVISELEDFFSPENTASRILDFALAQYKPKDGADTEATRQTFSDTMGGLIQKGFDKAQAILGNLPDSIAEGIETTHKTVFDGLANFVKNGLAANQDEKTANIMAYYQAFKQNISITETAGTGITYNLYGKTSPARSGTGLMDVSA